jgi:hypothetical protein
LCAPPSSLSKLGSNIPRIFLSGRIPLPCTPSRSCRCSSKRMPVVGVDHIACSCKRIAAQTFGSHHDDGIASCSIQSWSTALQVGGCCRGCPGKFTCYQSPFLLCQEGSCSKPWKSQRCGTNGCCFCCRCWRNHS